MHLWNATCIVCSWQDEGYRDGCFGRSLEWALSQTQLVSAFSTMDPQQDKVEVVGYLYIFSGIAYLKREEKV